MGSDRYSWELVSDGNQEPAQLAAAHARIAELEAENAALRAGLKARDETIARLRGDGGPMTTSDRYSTITHDAAALLDCLAKQDEPATRFGYETIRSIGGEWTGGAKDLAYAALLSVRKEFHLEEWRKMYAAAAQALLQQEAGT